MSWSEFEYSVADGRPLTLYEFSRQNVYYRYTNADQSVTVNNQFWEATAISDNGLSANSNNSVIITLPDTNKVVSFYRGVPPSTAFKVRVYRMHHHDKSQQLRVVWVGTITEIKRENIGEAKIITGNIINTFVRQGLRLTYGRTCPYALYDNSCKVSSKKHEFADLEIIKIDGQKITFNVPNEIKNGYFSGGFIAYNNADFIEKRGIRVHDNNTLSLFGGTQGLSIGMKISIYPGCDNTIETCCNKFDNQMNYGGCPHMMGKSPYNITKLF